MIFPTIFGIIIYIYQRFNTHENFPHTQAPTILIPIFSIFLSLWGTILLEKWKRKENEMKVTWDLH